MATKRGHSPELVPNPFIKKRNLQWSIDITGSARDASFDSSSDEEEEHPQSPPLGKQPRAADVEAGEAQVEDHLGYFSSILSKATLSPFPDGMPHISIPAYRNLYEENLGNPKGAHFVIHQHDHPVAGTHYDLRLQINETSSASWAIMYGLPGDPNSRRLTRNATETRVHCLWNHLIETASESTGSLLIWDTGTYEVLSRRSKYAPAEDPASQPLSPDEETQRSEQEKLHQAFQTRKITIRLRGRRLPQDYVLNLRLTTAEDAAGRAKMGRKPTRRRRRGGRATQAPKPVTSSESELEDNQAGDGEVEEIVHASATVEAEQEDVSAMEKEIRELEDDQVRRTNAYTGATNTIGSVHQRKWFLSLDRGACGFVRRRRRGKYHWERNEGEGRQQAEKDGQLTYPFYVRGSDVERSVITGRRGADILRDEGVVGFVQRKGWRAVLN